LPAARQWRSAEFSHRRRRERVDTGERLSRRSGASEGPRDRRSLRVSKGQGKGETMVRLMVVPAVVVAVACAMVGCAVTGIGADQAESEASTTEQTDDQGLGERAMATETATFGAGCFWGVEETFRCMEGVVETAVGYAGGTTEEPTYEQVCSGRTGHAEVVQVQYDPAQVSYEELLAKFFELHDPTQVNRQGPDVGDQYRSVIFYHDDQQKQAAETMKAELDASGRYRRPIATQIEPAPTFWRAEEYHQQYIMKRGGGGCSR
jgi:peptide-methionine (S)-S-oxide reductase